MTTMLSSLQYAKDGAFNMGLEALDTLSNVIQPSSSSSLLSSVSSAPPVSPHELGFPENPFDIGERYYQVHKYITSIREEKVWKTFKLCDAEFAYQQSYLHYPLCFQPMFLVHECEIHLLRYSMCSTEHYLGKVIQICEQAVECTQNVLKSLDRIGSVANQYEKEYGLIRLECNIILAEIVMIQSMIEFKKKNYMTAAHTMLRGHQQYAKEVQSCLKEQHSLIDKRVRYEHILELCRQKKDMNMKADERLLTNLQTLIDEKTKEIRGMNYDRTKGDIPDSVIEATRELLQMKSLYKDLSGKWKSSDGHADAIIDEDKADGHEESDLKPHHLTSQFNAAFSKHIDEDDDADVQSGRCSGRCNDENAAGNVYFFANSPVKQHQQQNSKNKAFDRCTVAQLEKSYQKTLNKNSQANLQKYHSTFHFDKIKSPKKIGLPVINVVIPRLGDIARYLEIDQIEDPKVRKSGIQHPQERNTNGKKAGKGGKEGLGLGNIGRNQIPSSPLHPSTGNVNANEDDLMEQLDYQSILELNPDIFYQHVFLTKARVAFAEAVFNIGLTMIPQQISWILAIVGIKANPMKALTTLYNLHNFDDCKWNHLATLLLLNLPLSYLQELHSSISQEASSESLQKLFGIQKIEQFHALIEAQSLLKNWTAKNPLWLITSALTYSEENASNLLSRVDFYRRALVSEKDAFSAQSMIDTNNSSTFSKYYDIHAKMAKHFVSLGHWTKALSSSRQINLPAINSKLTLEGYALLRAASAALIVNEDFNYQNKYLQLKFADKFIYNAGGSGANITTAVAEGISEKGSKKSSDVSDMVITMNRKCSLESLVSLISHQNISDYDSSLYSRLLTFDQYQIMLKNDSQQHHAEADIIVREYLSSWCWLLPLELTYVTFHNENLVSEASHAQMLQLCDKGALLFAEKYLQSHLLRDEVTAQHFNQLKDLISSIIVDELSLKDSIVVKKAISPTCKLQLFYEHSLLTGLQALRVGTDDPMGEKDSTILINSLISSGKQELSKIVLKNQVASEPGSTTGSIFQFAISMQSGTMMDEKQAKALKASKLLKKIMEKQDRVSDAVRQSSFTMISQHISDIYTVFCNQRSDKVVGDVILLWLLVRGCVLIEINRIWEAVMMFKLIECLKDTAPQSKFVVFIAYYKLAHLVVTYDICENPLMIGSEYLKRSAVYMQRALDANLLPYVFEYSSLVHDLASKFAKQ